MSVRPDSRNYRALALITVTMALTGCLDELRDDDDDSTNAAETDPTQENRPPVISGTIPSEVAVGERLDFRPTASDPDGDSLEFSAANLPAWSSINSQSGRLTGTPSQGDVRDYRNVMIYVSDGTTSRSIGPFEISVVDAAAAANRAPSISGTPASQVSAGTAYQFTPTATDPDGDDLTFSITNRPVWANFDATNGALSGTPSTSELGTYANVQISVSDGTATTGLPSFTVEVVSTATGSMTLSWDAPTQNTDGSALTDLAGYRLYYGQQTGDYTDSVEIQNAGTNTYVIDELVPGTYYIAATSVNSAGVESAYSAEVTRQVTVN
ncbi:MAG: putative Ig domain-containing protein [Pseudomonadota bacterium]